MIDFLHSYLPQSVLFQIGPISIHWYGVFIAAGILAGTFLAARLAQAYQIDPEKMYDVALYAALGGLIGARAYAVFLEFSYYVAHPFEIIAVWHGGLAIHGGIIGALFALIIYCKIKSMPFWRVIDVAAPALALGQAIGRFGNYFNQEIFGTPTDLPWGIPIAPENRPAMYSSFTYFHPTFLYESILNIANLTVLLVLRRYLKQPGAIFFVYLINYAIIRILMEQLRTDVAPEFFGIRVPVLVSLVMIVISVAAIFSFGVRARGGNRKESKLTPQ